MYLDKVIHINNRILQEAIAETYLRYPQSMGAVVFLLAAAGVSEGEITESVTDWAEDKVNKIVKTSD
jgi:hypothetical protein